MDPKFEQPLVAMFIGVCVMVLFGIVAIVGALLGVPGLALVLGAILVLGAALYAFVRYDANNTFVKMMHRTDEIPDDEVQPFIRQMREKRTPATDE